MKPHQKAWTVDKRCFQEPWFAPDITVFAERRSIARALAFAKIDYDYGIGFIDFQIKRDPQFDKFLIDGKLKSKRQIEREKALEEYNANLDALLKDNPGKMAYIKKGGYYYQSGFCGYTEYIDFAGVYTIEEAVNSCRRVDINDCMRAIVIDPVEHNERLMKKIESFKSRLIEI